MPRLRSGELAPGIRALTAVKRRSVEQLIGALEAALEADAAPSAQLVDRFRTFESLAQWKDPQKGIVPMSVNTLKTHIGAVYTGGLIQFRRARRRLISRSESGASPIGGLKDQLRRLRSDHQVLMNSVIAFSGQYLDLLRRAGDLAKTHKFLQAELRSHARLFPNSRMTLQLLGKR